MFSFIKTSLYTTKISIKQYTHFCRIFGSVDLHILLPRPAGKSSAPHIPVSAALTVHYAVSSVGDCQQENSSFKSHFLQVHLFQTKVFEMHFRFLLYIWVRVDCRPTSQQIYKRTSSNLIRKGTGCDEYVEDQLNVASKNFAKYLFDDTDGKDIWKIFAP